MHILHFFQIGFLLSAWLILLSFVSIDFCLLAQYLLVWWESYIQSGYSVSQGLGYYCLCSSSLGLLDIVSSIWFLSSERVCVCRCNLLFLYAFFISCLLY